MNLNSINILRWYSSTEYQNHRKYFAYGQVIPVICEIDRLPPFQMVRSVQLLPITELVLVNFYTGAETDITTEAIAAGLSLYAASGYDLVIYPDLVPLLITTPPTGLHYLRMTDANDSYYSEVFKICDDVSDLIKIEYWHSEDFLYPGGHIRYDAPFKSRVYIPADIARPSYQYEDQVEKRDGYNLPIQQIRYKSHKFNFYAAEFFIDGFSVIQLHDFVQITYQRQLYEVDEMLMNDPDWKTPAFFANVEVEFRTDTVVIVNARALLAADFEYLPTAGSCVTVDHAAVGRITNPSTHYTNFTYEDADGDTVSLVNGDKILITAGATTKLYEYSSSSYSLVAVSGPANIYSEGEDLYWSVQGPSVYLPQITWYDGGPSSDIAGYWVQGAIHTFYAIVGTEEILLGSFTSTELLAGVHVDLPTGTTEIKLVISSSSCGAFYTPANYSVPTPGGSGIGWMTIGTTNIVG